MKTIYIKNTVPILVGDVVKASFPLFVELEILDTHLLNYEDSILDLTSEKVDEIETIMKKELINKLWENCNKHQESKISTLGIFKLNEKPEPNTKAQAILGWIEQLWADYYARRDCIEGNRIGADLHTIFDCVTKEISDLFDFRNNGDIPYSYREAMSE